VLGVVVVNNRVSMLYPVIYDLSWWTGVARWTILARGTGVAQWTRVAR